MNTNLTEDREAFSLDAQWFLLHQRIKEDTNHLNEKEWIDFSRGLAGRLIDAYGREQSRAMLEETRRYSAQLLKMHASMNEEESFQSLRRQKIEAYIQKHYAREISLEEIASLVGMTPGSLCRFYKAFTGQRLKEYILTVRIEAAAAMLQETEESVSSVGYGCGFNTFNYFIKVFKRAMGATPLEWRNGGMH